MDQSCCTADAHVTPQWTGSTPIGGLCHQTYVRSSFFAPSVEATLSVACTSATATLPVASTCHNLLQASQLSALSPSFRLYVQVRDLDDVKNRNRLPIQHDAVSAIIFGCARSDDGAGS